MRSTTGLAALACLAAVIAIAAGRPQASSAPQQDHAPQPPGGLSSTAPAQEQETRPRFRADIELVQLDVSVLARDRKPVGGLTAADFTVLENGRVRPIRAFAPVQLSRPASPAPGGWATTVTPDVATNQIGAEDGRLVIILMDRSIPVGPPTTVARRVATAAIEALGPQDLAAVVSTSGGIPQNLTADRTRLVDAIDQRDWSTRISKEQEEIVGKEDPLSDGRCLCGLCVLETVTNVSDAVRHAPRRRKLLLFIGSRLIVQAGPRAPSADIGCSGRLADARRRLTDSLALSNLTVHSIDPGGLVNLGPQARAGAGGGKPGQDGPVLRRQALRVETTEQLEEYGSLRVLPELTGGRTVLNTNAPESAVPEIFRESDAYYVLGFEPDPSTRADTAPRSIEVKVSRRDVTVHAQRRHVAERAEDRPASDASGSPGAVSLTGALSGLLPNAGRPLVLAAAAFAGDDPAKAIASISVDVGAFVPAAGGTVALDLALAAVDPGGTPVASARQTSTVVLPRSAAGRAPEAIVQTQLEVPPGEHEIRVAVSDPATGAIGSVFSPLSVPRFGSAALSMSDVVLSAEPATGVSSAVPGGQASATTRRTFNGEDRVRARLAVYQGTDRTAPILPVSIRARVLDLDGAAVRDHTLRLAETQFTNRRAACQIALDVERLPPGEYLLRLDAGAGEEAASRAVRFAVR